MDLPELRRAAGAYRLSQAIHAFAELRLADSLAAGPRTAADVAAERNLHEPYLRRLLRALASEGVIEATPDGRFAVTEASSGLGSGCAFGDMVRGWSLFPPTYAAFGRLADAVRTGRPPFELAHGTDWATHLAAHPEVAAAYDEAMESTVDAFATMLQLYDFSRFTTVADVGGGGGGFLVAFLRANPGAHGICFDLPAVVDTARRRGVAADVADRLELRAGNFFADPLPAADAYLLNTVLRVFDDDQAGALLRAVRRAMPDTAVVVVQDFWLPEGIPPSPFGLADLQALCAYAGRDRTRSEYEALLGTAGLRLGEVVDVEGSPYAIFEALPAG